MSTKSVKATNGISKSHTKQFSLNFFTSWISMKALFCRFVWKSFVDPYFRVHLVVHFCSKDEDTTQNSQRWILHLDTKSFTV